MSLETFMKDYYAPILATIVGLFQLIGYLKDRRPRIKVESSIGTQAIVYESGSVGPYQKTLFITVTNLSKEIRVIEVPQIIIKVNGKRQNYTVIDFTKTDYPKSLSPGTPHLTRIGISDLNDLPPERDDNVRFMVRDTHGKVYKSKSLLLPK